MSLTTPVPAASSSCHTPLSASLFFSPVAARPSSSSAVSSVNYSDGMEFQILERVSNLTLSDASPAPATPQAPFQTPVLKKRKPSVCVTPPRGDNNGFPDSNDDDSMGQSPYQRKKARSVPFVPGPLLPNSPEFEQGKSSYQHFPCYSPKVGTGQVNMEFVRTLQQQQEPEAATFESQRARLSREIIEAARSFPVSNFPDLEGPTRSFGPSKSKTRRVLKMRRGANDRVPVLSGPGLL